MIEINLLPGAKRKRSGKGIGIRLPDFKALSACAMSDNLVTGEALSPADRQSSLADLAKLALDVAVGDAGKDGVA